MSTQTEKIERTICDNCEEETREDIATPIFPRWHLCPDCVEQYPGWFTSKANVQRWMSNNRGKEFPSPELIENKVWLVIEGEDAFFGSYDTVEAAKKDYEKLAKELRHDHYFGGIYDGKESTGLRPKEEIIWK